MTDMVNGIFKGVESFHVNNFCRNVAQLTDEQMWKETSVDVVLHFFFFFDLNGIPLLLVLLFRVSRTLKTEWSTLLNVLTDLMTCFTSHCLLCHKEIGSLESLFIIESSLKVSFFYSMDFRWEFNILLVIGGPKLCRILQVRFKKMYKKITSLPVRTGYFTIWRVLHQRQQFWGTQN